MEPSIFKFIRRYSWRQQLMILGLSALLLPVGLALLQLTKLIINRALGDNPNPEFLGQTWGQLDLLWTLCGLFLLTVLVQGGLKYIVNVFAGVVAERELRRLRFQLYNHVLRFPLPYFKKMTQAELVQMINAEVEPLGGFINGAVSIPGVMGGTLIYSLFFMFAQDLVLGLAAIALYPLQIWLIPKLQAKVNALGKARVRQVRRNAEKIGEIASGVRDIRANDASLYESARFSRELGKVFDLRFNIYKRKFVIKFINNFLAQLGPFFFYAIGGYLVLEGDVTIGALVAVIGAQKDIASPWKELLAFYQLTYDTTIKYDQVVAQFAPPHLRSPERLTDDPPADAPEYRRELRLSHVGLTTEDDETILEGVTASIKLPARVGVIGSANAGKDELLLMIANLIEPSSGTVKVDDVDLAKLPDSVTGRRSAFVASPASLFSGSIRDNLLFGLKFRPVGDRDPSGDRASYLLEANRSGNSEYFPDDDWDNFQSVGLTSEEERESAMIEALRHTAFDNDVYIMGLRNTLAGDQDSELVGELLQARRALQSKLREDQSISRLVEQFDPQKYNQNASVAENLLFGTPVGDSFDPEHLSDHPFVRQVLKEVDLTDDLLRVGIELASTMVELFADLPPDHEYFRQFSFIEAEELPGYKALISGIEPGQFDRLSEVDRQRLTDLPFKLIPARHRLGLIDDELTKKLLAARNYFRENLPADLAGSVEFFDPLNWNHASSVQDNLLFGKVVYGQAMAAGKISSVISEILDQLDLTVSVIEVGMRTECGTGGARLTATQRQKLAMARALMKRPQMLIMSDPTAPLDAAESRFVRDTILDHFQDRTVIWAPRDHTWAEAFDHILVLEKGRLVENGTYEELMAKGGVLHALVEGD